MWWRTRWRTRSIVSLGKCSLRRRSSAISAPTVSWPRKCPSAAVAGLPTSWRSAASRTIGRSAGAASTARSVWSQRSSPATLFWATPRCAASSGEMRSSIPVSAASRRPTDGRSAVISFSSSRAIRSPDRWRTSAACSDRLERRGLDGEAQRCGEADRTDHPERVLREPTDRDRRPREGGGPRDRPARRTGRPARPAASPGRRGPPQAIALIVKSRRERSTRSCPRTRPDGAGGSRRSRARSGRS